MLEVLKKKLPYSILFADRFDWFGFDFSGYHRLVIIAEEKVAHLYADALGASFERQMELLTFPGGEEHKNRVIKAGIEDQLLALGCTRDTLLFALGGGITLDLVGFIAATYCRGIPVIYCPTTLLAMVDASIGGKTGVNTAYGKNLIGCFYQPRLVMINLTTLQTLDSRHYMAGLAEVMKHALIADQAFWDWLLEHQLLIKARQLRILEPMITQSLAIKAKIVAEDFKEQGQRQILNFGHTFAHALEKILNYQILHGEAVALGMIFEAHVSYLMGHLTKTNLEAIQAAILGFGFTCHDFLDFSLADLLAAMAYDKKNQQSQVYMSLLQTIGQVYQEGASYSFAISPEILAAALSQVRRLC